jgi:hypothetical protein
MRNLERLDIPYATVVVFAAGSFLDRDVIVEPINELRAEHGLKPGRQLEMLTLYLVLPLGGPGTKTTCDVSGPLGAVDPVFTTTSAALRQDQPGATAPREENRVRC